MIISAMKVVQMILKERPRVCLISHVSRKDLPTKKTKQGRVIATLLRRGFVMSLKVRCNLTLHWTHLQHKSRLVNSVGLQICS